ncbi:PREDICTED: uncharacterized protein LOC109289438 isoform X2 [Gavialis gangeticus]|nr:PREDICTED: uncharacterized protein LOC109289438 isoform X2 [Gavialis gangeticus]
MAGRIVRVGGIPTDIPPESVADKLTIHFLRTRNGGGEIADIQITTDCPGHALITFEEEEVAQRVLKMENHILSTGGKKYLLKVTAALAQPSPDEIFVGVSMIIDYGKFPDGKTLLRNLRKDYSNVQVSFDRRETLCTIKGPFMEMQAFSNQLLHSLNLGGQPTVESRLAGACHVAKVPYMSDSQQASRSPQPEPQTKKQPSGSQACEEAAERPLHREPVDGEAVEQLEDFSLVMDSDIYLYMQKFCRDQYQEVLQQHKVDVVDVSSDGVTILYLQASSEKPGDIGSLVQARLVLLQLYQQLEFSLRKEKISKRELSGDSRMWGGLPSILQKLYPQLLCHEDEKHLCLIGNMVDLSLAKQYIQDLSSRLEAEHVLKTPSASLAPNLAALHRVDKSAPTADVSTSRLRPGRLEPKGEHKLAVNFSVPKAMSLASAWPTQDRSSLVAGQGKLPGSWLKEAKALGQSSPAAQNQPAAEAQQKDQKELDRMKSSSLRARPKNLILVSSNREGIPQGGQSLGSLTSSGPVKPQPLSSMSNAFQSLGLFDTTGTCSALDSKPLLSKGTLRRSNSFSIPQSKESSKPQDSSQTARGDPGVMEEISLDAVQWAYLKDVHQSAIEELCREAGVRLTEEGSSGCTSLMLQAEDRTKVLQAKWKMESLCLQVCPTLICQSLSYSELDVDGPSDEALAKLCSLLKGCSTQVHLSKDRYKLQLTCPKGLLPKVSEVFQRFSAWRLHALHSSPQTPGLGSTRGTECPGTTQEARSPDPPLGTGYHCSLGSLQMGLKQLEICSDTDQSDTQDGGSGQIGADELGPESLKRSILKASDSQPVLGPGDLTYQLDSRDGQGDSGHIDTNLADNQHLSPRDSQDLQKEERPVGELEVARVKQVLPDKFQLTRDRSRGSPSEEAGSLRPPFPTIDGAPQSLPIWLSSSVSTQPPRAMGERSSMLQPGSQKEPSSIIEAEDTQEEPKASEVQPRSPSSGPGQEASQHQLETCDRCQTSRTTTCRAPGSCTLCRTCFAAEDRLPLCSNTPSTANQGTFKISSLSQSLPGFYRDPTLKLVYNIPDGVQGAKDPRPGRPYKGGHFLAFLPDNREGKKTAQLLKKAFEHGLTFQIRSDGKEEKVTWGPIPHKTSLEGGKPRNGYPDSQYLKEVCRVLKNLGIE